MVRQCTVHFRMESLPPDSWRITKILPWNSFMISIINWMSYAAWFCRTEHKCVSEWFVKKNYFNYLLITYNTFVKSPLWPCYQLFVRICSTVTTNTIVKQYDMWHLCPLVSRFVTFPEFWRTLMILVLITLVNLMVIVTCCQKWSS